MAESRCIPSSYIVLLLLYMSFLIQSIQAWAVFDKQVNYPQQVVQHGNPEPLTNVLVSREESVFISFDKAKHLIQQLESSPVCAQVPTRRLLLQCKVLKTTITNNESAQALDNAKTVYGIRQAICETQQANANIPIFCGGFGFLSDTGESGVELFPERDIRSCLEAFRPDHAFWTSYSKFKQDASTLCDPARVDYQLEELITIYRQLTNVLPEVIETLQKQTQFSRAHMNDIHKATKSSLENIKQSSDHIQRQIQEHATEVSQVRRNISEFLDDLQTFQTSLKDRSAQDIRQADEAMALFERKSEIAQSNFASIFASIAEYLTGIGMKIEDLHSHLEPAREVLDNIHILADSGRVQELVQFSAEALLTSNELELVQTRQLNIANLQHEIMRKTLKDQETSKSIIDDANKSLDGLRDNMDNFAQFVNSFAMVYQNFQIKSIIVVAAVVFFFSLFILARFPKLTTAVYLLAITLGCELIWWFSSWRARLRLSIINNQGACWIAIAAFALVICIGSALAIRKLARRRSSTLKLNTLTPSDINAIYSQKRHRYQSQRKERCFRASTVPPDVKA